MPEFIYKLCQPAEWDAAEAEGLYTGSPVDRQDGFIHFSTAEQLPGTLAKHYAGAEALVLVAIRAAALGEPLRYEPSRDGALFPHLYGPLALWAVEWTKTITRGPEGAFILPQACV